MLLVMLDDLESRFRRLAGLSPRASVDSDDCEESDTMASLTTMLVRAAQLAARDKVDPSTSQEMQASLLDVRTRMLASTRAQPR